jgi:antitoxin (DNA-binding transcriptional repressor) of toxin-antitoxin stability system
MMLLVTLAEARERLPELIHLMASGEKVVITDGEEWVAALAAPPPMPLTPEQEAARQARVKEAIREMVKDWGDFGVEIPRDSPLGKLLAEVS